jgi:hypothetical protein
LLADSVLETADRLLAKLSEASTIFKPSASDILQFERGFRLYLRELVRSLSPTRIWLGSSLIKFPLSAGAVT